MPSHPAWRKPAERVRNTRNNSFADYLEEGLNQRDRGMQADDQDCYDWHNDITNRGRLPNGKYWRPEFVRRYERGEYRVGRFPSLDRKYGRGADGNFPGVGDGGNDGGGAADDTQ